MAKPLYPPEAKAKRIEGLVKIDVVHDRKGVVTKANAISGPEAPKAAALEAARQWSARSLGVAVKVAVNINYKLASKEKPAKPNPKS